MPVTQIPTPEPFAGRFRDLGIAAVTYAHPPVFTVEEGRDFEHMIPGGHTKNLFLKDKKDGFWLVTALQDTVIDLKSLRHRLSAPPFSFGNAEKLMALLGVAPGSVTPLALLNDKGRAVRPVLDARLMACATVNIHPLVNDKTTGLKPQDLLAFMRALGYDPRVVDFNAA